MIGLGDLQFSPPILLSCRQSMSVVVDGVGEKGNPQIGNYGLIYQGSQEKSKVEKMTEEEQAQQGSTSGTPETEEEELLKEGYHTVNINKEYFLLKACFKNLNAERNFNEVFADQSKLDENNNKIPEDADAKLTEDCASGLEQIFSFTVKTFPNYGAYGYVNFNLGEESGIQIGKTLDSTRGSFDAYK